MGCWSTGPTPQPRRYGGNPYGKLRGASRHGCAVREGHRRPELEGMSGTIEHCWGSPDYLALDVRLEDGRSELFWFHQLDTGFPVKVAYYDGS